ncbi:MAG: hypothetical protein K6G80_00735 [Treponema sp.]|nr:hypothetical protein [Treponema sp.]
MTLDSFRFKINVQQPLEFFYRSKTYNMTYGTDDEGSYIAFGRLYDTPEKYRSVGELLNNAKVENSFLREVLQDI